MLQVLISREIVVYENIFSYQPSPSATSATPYILESDSSPPSSPTTTIVEYLIDYFDIPVPNQPRRSTRAKSKPTWLTDFVCNIVQSPSPCAKVSTSVVVPVGSSYPINIFPYHPSPMFHDHYISCMANVSAVTEPSSYRQAFTDARWVKAMQDELAALERY